MPESRQNNASPFNQLPEDDVYLVKVGGARTIDWQRAIYFSFPRLVIRA